MSDLLGTTLQELLQSLKAKRIRVPSEIGAFVALEVCEALSRGPARVSTSDVRIADDGMVSLFVPPNSATQDEAARAIVGLLASVLVAAGTGAPAALIRLVEDGAPTGAGCLDRLRDDLEAALVPLNRQAARRVLARMVREGKREQPRALSDRPGPASRLDADLDDLLEPRSTEQRLDSPPPRLDSARRKSRPSVDPIDALLAETADEAPSTLAEANAHAFREAETAAPPPGLRTPPPAAANDIDELLREAPTLAPGGLIDRPGSNPASKPSSPSSASPSSGGQVEAPATLFDGPTATPGAAARKPAASTAGRPGPSAQGPDRFDDLSHLDEPPKRGGIAGYLGAFVLVALLAAGVLAFMRPDLVDRALGRPPPPPEPAGPTPEEREAAARAERGRYGTITVTSTPPAAQVMLFVGRAPAVIEDLTPGVAYEMMALVDGRAPQRVILPPDASWETTPEGLRYELAIQVSETPMELAVLALGDSILPEELGTPRAELGVARVITTPPGAKVYMLIGFTPDVRVENISTEEVAELLVWAEGYETERLVVAPSDWVEAEDGSKTADVEALLREVPRGRR